MSTCFQPRLKHPSNFAFLVHPQRMLIPNISYFLVGTAREGCFRYFMTRGKLLLIIAYGIGFFGGILGILRIYFGLFGLLDFFESFLEFLEFLDFSEFFWDFLLDFLDFLNFLDLFWNFWHFWIFRISF